MEQILSYQGIHGVKNDIRIKLLCAMYAHVAVAKFRQMNASSTYIALPTSSFDEQSLGLLMLAAVVCKVHLEVTSNIRLTPNLAWNTLAMSTCLYN